LQCECNKCCIKRNINWQITQNGYRRFSHPTTIVVPDFRCKRACKKVLQPTTTADRRFQSAKNGEFKCNIYVAFGSPSGGSSRLAASSDQIQLLPQGVTHVPERL
jgi:hypothetical protein